MSRGQLFSLMNLGCWLFFSCQNQEVYSEYDLSSEVSHVREEQFIRDLIEQGALDSTISLSVESGQIHEHEFQYILCEKPQREESSPDGYDYDPDKYKQQAIDAYVSYGTLDDSAESKELKIPDFDSLDLISDSGLTVSIDYGPQPCQKVEAFFGAKEVIRLKSDLNKQCLENWGESTINLFEAKTSEFWYVLSHPIFSESGDAVLMKSSKLCLGLCGYGEIVCT